MRVACSYIKRHSGGSKLENEVGDKARGWLRDVLRRLQDNDPAQGTWTVLAHGRGKAWCDASSLALGVVVEMDGRVVEDAA